VAFFISTIGLFVFGILVFWYFDIGLGREVGRHLGRTIFLTATLTADKKSNKKQ